MSDIFNQNQPADDQQTRAVPPVGDKPAGRRRRTERNRDAYEDVQNVQDVQDMPAPAGEPEAPAEEQPAPQAPVTEAPAQEKPAQQDVPAGSTTVVPRVQIPTVEAQEIPSQGIPRPAVLGGQTTRRPAVSQNAGTVRRPVNAEGYSPIAPLGAAREGQNGMPAPRTRRPEAAKPQWKPAVEAKQPQDPQEQEKSGGKGRMIAIIVIVVLLLTAIGLGAWMLFGGDDEVTPPRATSLISNVSKATAPYEIDFTMSTSGDVTQVRVVDAQGNVLPTTIKMSTVLAGGDIHWLFTVTLENEYEGQIRVQVAVGETWMDTDQTQHIMFDSNSAPVISRAPGAFVTPSNEKPVKATDALTADSSGEPTVSPAMAETTELPVAPVMTAVPEPVVTQAPTVLPATATPTLMLTPTPTLSPTATPEPAATLEPTEEPTQEPTPEPTAEPTPTPIVTPKLVAQAADSADPSLITVQKIYNGTKEVDEYERNPDQVINMPAGDDYLLRDFGVTTFRGNAFRQNAASGVVEDPTGLSLLWTAEGGSLAASSRTFYGFGWPGQPAIVKWSRDMRQVMNFSDERKDQSALTEVIIAGQDGQIYFLDVKDGTETRDAIELGYPMRSTPSLHTLGVPVMTVGQYSRFLKNKTGDIGLYYYNLFNQKKLRFVDGLDGKTDRQYNDVGAFDTSAIFDRNSNTLIALGTNGLLYTEKLNTEVLQAADGGVGEFNFKDPAQVVLMSHTKGQDDAKAAVESSLAMYGSYAFYADLGGVLRCVDTTTMTTQWAVETGDAVKAAIALDLEEDTHTLWLYTATTLNRAKKGEVTIRRYNAMTGELDWSLGAEVQKSTGKKDSYGKDITAGAMASPVVGQHDLGDLVYFTLSSLTKKGNAVVTGNDAEALAGVVIALNKQTGEIVWTKDMEAYCYSSPVAVYDAQGKGWLIQACSNGTIYLMDGLSGVTVGTLQVNGTIEASPAVFGDILVVGTTGKKTSFIYGIKLD